MKSSKKSPFPPASSTIVCHHDSTPPSEQKMTSSWPDPPSNQMHFAYTREKRRRARAQNRALVRASLTPSNFIFFRLMLFKIDINLVCKKPLLARALDQARATTGYLVHLTRYISRKIGRWLGQCIFYTIVNLESRPSYDTIFQHLLKLNYFE